MITIFAFERPSAWGDYVVCSKQSHFFVTGRQSHWPPAPLVASQ
jgi:hypothetical protein